MSRAPKGKRAKKVFYIITEGKTEEGYISKFTQEYRCSAVRIIKIKPCGAKIIHRASDVWKKDKTYRANPGPKGVIIDKDTLTEDDFNNILKDAENKEINVFFSNSAFEVWLLAHYELITISILSSSKLKERLSRNLSQEYKKGDAGQLRKIVAHFDQAIKNTKNVCEVSYHTQCTNVGKLCQNLQEDT